MSEREDLIRTLGLDPILAHAVVFGKFHSHPTPAFHKQMILDWHSDVGRVLDIAFRGGGKSTLAEEACVLMGAQSRVRNVVVLAESEQKAAERLKAIKWQFENNETLLAVYGVETGEPWGETRAQLSNGTIFQSYGRHQSLRGVKNLDQRPDLIFIDDLEDDDSVATPEGRSKTRSYLTKTVIPSMAPNGRIRMAATPLHPDALTATLSKASENWLTRTYPIIFKDPGTALWRATWPERFSVAWALKMQAEFLEINEGQTFVQEYLCQAEDPATKTFTAEMIRVAPETKRTWHPVYAIYDPARTTNKQSATTGIVAASWVRSKLIVWDGWARKLMPDAIVGDMFDVERKYNPVAIGVEKNGLDEWLLQPIRTEQATRGVVLPLRPLSAPKGKLDFIRGLQPYFRAGEVEFATELPDLRAQLLGFPTGHIDAPNALAYMLRIKNGLPIYDGFRPEHIVPAAPAARWPLWLCVNTDGRIVTAVLAQMQRGRLVILMDWLYEGDAGQVLPDIVHEASLERPSMRDRAEPSSKTDRPAFSQAQVRLVAPRRHFDDYSPLGLRAAAKMVPINVAAGGDAVEGREALRGLLEKSVHGETAFAVSEDARWTLRALHGGYARELDARDPTPGGYAVLMEGLEAFAARLGRISEDLDENRNYAYTPDGRRYLSSLAG